MIKPTRIAVISTHVIQHFPPLYRRLALEPSIVLRVFYGSTAGASAYMDREFGCAIAWNSDLLSGYEFELLSNATRLPIGFSSLCGSNLERRLDAFDPDGVFLLGYRPLLMLRALAYARRRSCHVYMMTDSELLHHRAYWKQAVKALLLPALLRQINGFLTIGDNNEAYLRKYGVPAAKLVRGGYPTDEDSFLAVRRGAHDRRAHARRVWGIPAEAFVALYVGKLIRRKRPQDLADAVALLNRSYPSIIGLFVGEGDLKERITSVDARYTPGSIRVLGFVNQASLPDVYAAADVLVHPAEADPHPLSITEATMAGLPVIVSDQVGAVGATDTAQPNVNALVYESGNVESLARCLETLIKDARLYDQMRSATADVIATTGLAACATGFVRLVVGNTAS